MVKGIGNGVHRAQNRSARGTDARVRAAAGPSAHALCFAQSI